MSNDVDVIMPVYNAAHYLKESIESILDQTYTDFSFIIVDDGSTDGSWKILQQYAKRDTRIKLIRNKTNKGIPRTRNTAIAAGKGKYILNLDPDDRCTNDRVATQVAYMQQHPSVGICGSHLRWIDQNGNSLSEKHYPQDDKSIRKLFFVYSAVAQCTSIIRREIYDKVGGYDNKFTVTEDLDLFLRMGRYSKFANIDRILTEYRTYDNNSSHKKHRLMIRLAIKARINAILYYKYRPNALGILAIIASICIIPFPAYFVHAVFSKFRSLMY